MNPGAWLKKHEHFSEKISKSFRGNMNLKTSHRGMRFKKKHFVKISVKKSLSLEGKVLAHQNVSSGEKIRFEL